MTAWETAIGLTWLDYPTIEPAVVAERTWWSGVRSRSDVSTSEDRERGRRRRGLVAKHTDDLKLVERMLRGDEAAFEVFGERCFKAVYRFTLARLRGDRDLSQEIVQTAMAKALSRLDTYRGDASLTTWLCACCRNEILMHFRRQRTAPSQVELEDEMERGADPTWQSTGDAETELLEREEVEQVHMALDQLPDSYAQALEWMYIERIPVKEIASRLGVQEKAAESLLTRARKAFRTSYSSLKGS